MRLPLAYFWTHFYFVKPTAWNFGLKLKLEYFWSNDPNETPDKVRYRQVGKFPRRIMIHATISRKGVSKVKFFPENIYGK